MTRCCKDLGIANDLWDPIFITTWKENYADRVTCINQKTSERKVLWRRKDRSSIQYPWKEEFVVRPQTNQTQAPPPAFTQQAATPPPSFSVPPTQTSPPPVPQQVPPPPFSVPQAQSTQSYQAPPPPSIPVPPPTQQSIPITPPQLPPSTPPPQPPRGPPTPPQPPQPPQTNFTPPPPPRSPPVKVNGFRTDLPIDMTQQVPMNIAAGTIYEGSIDEDGLEEFDEEFSDPTTNY